MTTPDHLITGFVCALSALVGYWAMNYLLANWHRIYGRLAGENHENTPVAAIVDQLNEPRPLPLGRRDFQEWTHRIITGAMLPVVEGEDPIAFIEGQKFALATMIMHLGPTESHKPDAYFIHSLRKSASNQVAHTILQELKLARMEKAKGEAARVEAEAAEMRAKAEAHQPIDYKDIAQVTMSEGATA